MDYMSGWAPWIAAAGFLAMMIFAVGESRPFHRVGFIAGVAVIAYWFGYHAETPIGGHDGVNAEIVGFSLIGGLIGTWALLLMVLAVTNSARHVCRAARHVCRAVRREVDKPGRVR